MPPPLEPVLIREGSTEEKSMTSYVPPPIDPILDIRRQLEAASTEIQAWPIAERRALLPLKGRHCQIDHYGFLNPSPEDDDTEVLRAAIAWPRLRAKLDRKRRRYRRRIGRLTRRALRQRDDSPRQDTASAEVPLVKTWFYENYGRGVRRRWSWARFGGAFLLSGFLASCVIQALGSLAGRNLYGDWWLALYR
jgi:hypothetical protein